MAEDDLSPDGPLSLLRRIVIAVMLLCVVFLVLADTIGRFIEPTFHGSELMFGTLVGAIATLLGFGGIVKLMKR